MPVRRGSVAGGIVFRVTRNPRLTLCPFRILVDSDWSLSLIEVDSGGGDCLKSKSTPSED